MLCYMLTTLNSLQRVSATSNEETVEKVKERKSVKELDLKEFSPDDLTRLLKAQKDKDIDDLKSRYLATISKEQKSNAIVQQTEEQDSQKDDGDGLDGKKKPSGLPDLSALFPNGLPANIPYVPGGGTKPLQMVATTPDKTQLICECYAKGSKPTGDYGFNQGVLNQIQPSTSAQPSLPPFLGPIGNHFARKPKVFSQKKPKFNPFEALFMGFIKKPSHKRKPSGPYYPQTFPPIQQPNHYPSQVPIVTPNNGVKGGTGSGNGANYLPPSPGSVKGSFSKRDSSNKSKWHWYMDQFNDAERGSSGNYR